MSADSSRVLLADMPSIPPINPVVPDVPLMENPIFWASIALILISSITALLLLGKAKKL